MKKAMHSAMMNLTRIVNLQGRRFLLKVESSSDSRDYQKYEDLRNAIWDFPEDNLPGSRNMMCESFLHEGSSVFIAAYAADAEGRIIEDEEHFVGLAYGFVGLKDKARGFRSPDNLWFYSQYLGIKEAVRAYGLGVPIKEFQRDILLEQLGIGTIVCTYDPLTGVNAYRNVHHFGMEVADYRVATYGEYGGRLNRLDIPTDRFFMSWDLRTPVRLGPDATGFSPSLTWALEMDLRDIEGRTGPQRLEVVRRVNLAPGPAAVLLPIPDDFYLMLRETDVADERVRRIPLEWRLKTREAFLELFRQGFRVADFQRRTDGQPGNFYVLLKSIRKGDPS